MNYECKFEKIYVWMHAYYTTLKNWWQNKLGEELRLIIFPGVQENLGLEGRVMFIRYFKISDPWSLINSFHNKL